LRLFVFSPRLAEFQIPPNIWISRFARNDFELSEKSFCWFWENLYFCSMKTEPVIDHIKSSILKFVPAKCIYLFGSHAYGNPTENSDFDIYLVTPDDVSDFSQLYTEIIGDLRVKKIFFIDLLLSSETAFNTRKQKYILERTISQKGKIIYEQL